MPGIGDRKDHHHILTQSPLEPMFGKSQTDFYFIIIPSRILDLDDSLLRIGGNTIILDPMTQIAPARTREDLDTSPIINPDYTSLSLEYHIHTIDGSARWPYSLSDSMVIFTNGDHRSFPCV
jgi:hypothetical protein